MKAKAMNAVFKNNFIFYTLSLSTALLFVVDNGYGGEKKGQVGASAKAKAGEEILVARNITADRPFWCGHNGKLIFSKDDSGLFYYDIKTRKSVNIAEIWNAPSACTPDGEWLVYADKNTVRYDKGTVERSAVDVWRYRFKTGEKQKFTITDDRNGVFAPKGLKLYLGRRPTERMETPKQKWNILWSEGRGVGTLWLGDGSAVIGEYRDLDRSIDLRRDALEVEVFEPKRKIFSIYPEFPDFYLLLVDKQNRVYMEKRDGDKGIKSIVRCSIDIDKEALSCETILENVPMHTGFDVFSDGETMVFSKMREDNCIRIMRVGGQEARCITTVGLPVGSYVAVSSDEKRLAFERARHVGAKDFDDDLYIIELKTD